MCFSLFSQANFLNPTKKTKWQWDHDRPGRKAIFAGGGNVVYPPVFRGFWMATSILEHWSQKIYTTKIQVSHEKKPLTFHHTGCLIGSLIMAYYNPHLTVQYNPLYTLNN